MSLGTRLLRLLPPPAPPSAAEQPEELARTRARDASAPPPRATMLFATAAPPVLPLPGSGGLPLERALLLDVETTGLSRGAGTLVFLIACGRVRAGGGIEVRLGLMREPAEEPDLLAWLREELAAVDGIVTYNGRSFDVPLLRTRFALRRQSDPFAGRAHHDLLPLCRRVFGRPAKLVELEARVLGMERAGDPSGAEVARRYLRYLHSGDGRPLGAVLRHAARDVAALGRLAIHLGSPALRPAERAELAHAALAAGEPARADACARDALRARPGRAVAVRALHAMAEVARRGGDHAGASRAHESILAIDPADRAARRAVAIHYEHRTRDLAAALHHAHALGDARRAARLTHKLAIRSNGSTVAGPDGGASGTEP